MAYLTQSSQLQQIREEIDSLRRNIKVIQDGLYLRPNLVNLSQPVTNPQSRFTKPPVSPNSTHSTPIVPRSKSRLRRFTSSFSKLSRRGRSTRPSPRPEGKFLALQDESSQGLLCRRDSDESGATVESSVAPSSVDSDNELEEEPAALLAMLAPLVSALQQLTLHFLKLTPIEGGWDETSQKLDEICGALVKLFDELRILPTNQSANTGIGTKSNVEVPGTDSYDLEMRSLMLNALINKVSTERGAIRNAIRERHQPEPSVTASPSTSFAKGVLSGNNPFIIHSTSLRLEAVRRPSTSSKAISMPVSSTVINPGRSLGSGGGVGIGASLLAPPQSYRALIGGVSAWSNNVIRLGSYQASALFSPSPIAIKRMVGDGVKV